MTGRAAYSRIGAAEARSMRAVVDGLLGAHDPALAFCDLIARAESTQATAFERYAACILRDAGAQRLRNMSRMHAFSIVQPDNGRLAHITYSRALPRGSESAVLATECALNRLICIADAISDGTREDETDAPELKRSISLLGGGYLAPKGGWRTTRVKLPAVREIEDIGPAYYREIDWRCADNVASNARAVFQRSMRPNAYRTKLGIAVGHQSDWDVRTRLAQIAGALELPYRCSFRFDYDGSAKAAAAVFTCPPPSFLPAFNDGAARPDTGWVAPFPSKRARAYEAYLLRLACLFSAACFGSCGAMGCVSVAGFDASWNHPLVAMQFDRDRFVRSVLIAADEGRLSDPGLRFDPESTAALMDAVHLDWFGRAGRKGKRAVSLPDMDMRNRLPEPWEDSRELCAEAQALFRSRRICDVDTSHYLGGNADAVDLAKYDLTDSPIASVMRLESLVGELEGQWQEQAGEGATRRLFAGHPLERLAVCLLDDGPPVAEQAEAFLRGDAGRSGDASRRLQYVRAPSALFHARIGLSDLYQSMGDYLGATLQADRCIELAPTAASAYYRKADVLAEQGLLDQAANVLLAGLAFATTGQDASLLYYHAGMLFWHMGKRVEAAIVHAYNASLEGECAQRSKRVIDGMRARGDAMPHARLSSLAAKLELARRGLPVAPVDMRAHVLAATVALANSGSPAAAAPYAHALERYHRHDEIVVAACRSLRFGIGTM